MEKYTLNAIRIENSAKPTDEGLMHIEGYVCHFGKPNHNGEIVSESSFAKFFKELKNGGQMPMFNYNHDSALIIGGWDEIVSDDNGLYAKGHINTNVALVRDTIKPLMDSGDLNGLSTEGYINMETAEWDKAGNLIAKDFALTGIALVALPADFAAGIETQNRIELKRENKKDEKTFDNNALLI